MPIIKSFLIKYFAVQDTGEVPDSILIPSYFVWFFRNFYIQPGECLPFRILFQPLEIVADIAEFLEAALLICDYLSLKKSKPLIQTVIPTIHAGDSVGHPSDAGKKQQSRGNPLHVSSGSPHSSRGDAGDRLKNCKTRK